MVACRKEQFYLVWPFLVRRLSQQALGLVCLGTILLCPLLRYISARGIVPLGDPYTTTWLVVDNLATGALIAILLRGPAASSLNTKALTIALGVGGTTLLVVGFRFNLMSRTTAAGAAFQPEPFLLLFAAALLFALRYGDHPGVLRLTRPLRFFGYISYGLYLLHSIALGVYQNLYFRSTLPRLTAAPLLLEYAVVLAACTLICWLSRRYFEDYFLRMKDRLAPATIKTRGTETPKRLETLPNQQKQ
jgi:peptidoglycan/LPS O-acetylase OafA/YrhL